MHISPIIPTILTPKNLTNPAFKPKFVFEICGVFCQKIFFGAFEKFFENLIFCFYFFENFSLISPIFTKIRPQRLSFQPIFSRSFVLFLHCSFFDFSPHSFPHPLFQLISHIPPHCPMLYFSPLPHYSYSRSLPIPPIPLNPYYSYSRSLPIPSPIQSTPPPSLQSNPVKPHPLFRFSTYPAFHHTYPTTPIPLRAGAHSSARARVTHYARVTPATIYKYICHLSKPNFGNKKTPTEAGVSCFCSKTINALRIEVPYELCGDRISYVLLLWGHV